MKIIKKFAELCALPIGSFVQIKTKKCGDYVVVVCPSAVIQNPEVSLPAESTGAERSGCHSGWSRLPMGSLVLIYGLQERICFHAQTATGWNLSDCMVRGEFEAEGYRYEFYLMEPEEVCDYFIRIQQVLQNTDIFISCLRGTLERLEKYVGCIKNQEAT